MADEEYYDDDIIEETPEYSPKSEFSKADIVKSAVQRCIDSRGKEMREGYYNYQISNSGQTLKTWIEDSRIVYIGTVIALRKLLNPECRRGEAFQKFDREFNDEEERIFNKYAYSKQTYNIVNGRYVWRTEKTKYMPKKGAIISVPDVRTNRPEKMAGIWDENIDLYWDEMLDIYDELFARLNDLIDSLNYFKSVVSF